MGNPFNNLLLYSDIINTYSSSFFNSTGIRTFGYIEFDRSGNYTQLESSGDVLTAILKTDLKETTPIVILENNEKPGFSMGKLKVKSNNCIIMHIQDCYGLDNSINYIDVVREKENIKIRHFYFLSDKENHNACIHYLNILDHIKLFCKDFYNKFKTTINSLDRQSLSNAKKNEFNRLFQKFILQAKSEVGFDQYNNKVMVNGIQHSIYNNYFSKRELMVIDLYYSGSTLDEIASKVFTSERNVYRDFEKIRNKLQCNSNREILSKLNGFLK